MRPVIGLFEDQKHCAPLERGVFFYDAVEMIYHF